MAQKKLQQRLKELRHLHGYNQEYVASYLDISRQAYSHYETGRNTPNAPILCKIAKLYGIAPDNLLSYIIAADEEAKNYYQINQPASVYLMEDDLEHFLSYTNDSNNDKKLKYLTKREKELLFYFEGLPNADQEDFLDFMKIRSKRYRKK